jgi:type II pantothenate kinase
MAANNGPTINDITAAELAPLVAAAAQHDAVLGGAWGSGQLRVMNSGNDLPVIDLREVRQCLSGWSPCFRVACCMYSW